MLAIADHIPIEKRCRADIVVGGFSFAPRCTAGAQQMHPASISESAIAKVPKETFLSIGSGI